MKREDIIAIASKRYPDQITWDLLDALTRDAEIMEKAIMSIKDLPLFSSLQEERLKMFVLDCWQVGHIKIHGVSAYFQFVNWTDIIYALVKTNEPIFKPEYHV